MWDETGTRGSHYVGRKTLLNTAHILTSPATDQICPQSLPLITNTPPAVPESTCLSLSESQPCCLYLGEIASQQALSVEICGLLRPSEPVEGSTPARQTIAMAPIDDGLWSGDGCELNTSGSAVSARSLCDERRLWDETTSAFKDVQVFGWPAIPHQTRCSHETHTKRKLGGCLKAVHASVLTLCGLICQIFIAQLIGMGSGIKTETVKIYMWGGHKSWTMTWELQYVWVEEGKHHTDRTLHSTPEYHSHI